MDYKDWITERAEELTQEWYGKAFYELEQNRQDEVWVVAVAEWVNHKAARIDAAYDMEWEMRMGFCPTCKKFYEDEHKAFGACPVDEEHPLLHETKCQFCETKMYFQTTDDYCGPESEHGIICGVCAERMARVKNDRHNQPECNL